MATAELNAAAIDRLYSGWTNFKTWSVALQIDSDEAFSTIADQCNNFADFKNYLKGCGVVCTPNGVYFTDDEINVDKLNLFFWSNK